MQEPNEADISEYSVKDLIEDADIEAAAGYFLTAWFYHAMDAIRDARTRNGLTQSDVAEKIGTTQSVIARMENAHRGSFSLDRFLEYAWACGAAPLELEFVPPEELRRFAVERLGHVESGPGRGTWDVSTLRHEQEERSEQLG